MNPIKQAEAVLVTLQIALDHPDTEPTREVIHDALDAVLALLKVATHPPG